MFPTFISRLLQTVRLQQAGPHFVQPRFVIASVGVNVSLLNSSFLDIVSISSLFLTYRWCMSLKVKCSHYRPGVAQRVGRGIALLFHDSGKGVSGQQHTPALLYPRERPSTHFTGGWVGPRSAWKGGKSRPHRDSFPDRPARSQSLYQLSYLAHTL